MWASSGRAFVALVARAVTDGIPPGGSVLRIVVTGGAGYIGSHAVRALADRGHAVRVVDDLSTGHRVAVDPRSELYVLDIRDTPRLARILQGADAVMHFAAQSLVAQSVTDPIPYWDHNVGGSISLLEAMRTTRVSRLVFSSSAATYGVVDAPLIHEECVQNPINAYGATKLAVERLIRDVHRSDPSFSSATLRYFNVVGCAHGLGEDHNPETHLVPILLQAAWGQRDHLTLFGRDYPTPDGTCIRDYVHVSDLIDAHLLAVDAIRPGDARVYNVGLGRGWSVLEMIEAAKRVTGRDFPVEEGARRPGDPPSLVTDPSRIRRELGWVPRHPDVDDAIASAWAWKQHHPFGWSEREKPQVRDLRAHPSRVWGSGDAGGGTVLVPS